MRSRLRVSLLFLLIMLCSYGTAVQAKPLLKDGDRVVFLGDSITGELYYSRMIVDYFTLRYPGMHIQFYNVGYGGDTATRRLTRIQRDVLSLKPTLVTICFGMNDGAMTGYQENYPKAMAGLVSEIKKTGAQVVLLTPGCVDAEHDAYRWLKKDNWTYNETLEHLAKENLALAAKENLPVFHLYPLMLDIQTRAKKDDPKFTMIPDGIHPTPPGHAIMAYGLLKAFGCSEQASGLAIDAENGKATADRCTVDGLQVSEKKIAFTRTDNALPVRFYPDVTPVLKYLPLMEEYNKYPFRITGLKAPRWKLTVEGIEVGTFTSAELAAGVNLAMKPGPWQALAKRVDDAVVHEQAEFFQRWIYLSQYPAPDALKTELDTLITQVDAYVDQLQEQRFHVADARAWKWTLTAENEQH